MATTFKFELVSPERVLMSGDAEQVLLPGAEGDMTILPGHAPVISTLRPGILDIVLSGSKSRVFVKSGFAEVDPERVTVLAESAYDLAELDNARIASELAAAEAELSDAKDDDARFLANEAVSALTRLKGGSSH
jgi:F-type H+-transporting ATPase subunit epsilon